MGRLLVVHHSPTRSMRALTDAVTAGASDPVITGVEVLIRPALEATADDVLGARGLPARLDGELRLVGMQIAPRECVDTLVFMGRLLVVHHSPSRSMRTMTDAVVAGAHDPSISGVDVVVLPALEATADDVLTAQGYLLGSTANFGYMSGAMKHFFDTTFLQVGGSLDEHGGASGSVGATAKRPFGLYVHGRYDTTGAVRSILSITGALGWRQSAPVREVLGDVDATAIDDAYELGATLAALLL